VRGDESLPPFREMGVERLRMREAHLLEELRIEPRRHRRLPPLVPPQGRVLFAAVVLVAVVVTAPALALSGTVRELVGLHTVSHRGPFFAARVTNVVIHGPHASPGTLITITFTVGEQGKRPGVGVPRGSSFLVLVSPKSGAGSGHLAAAHGANGRYQTTTRLGPGSGIGSIQIGGFMPEEAGKVLNAGFWIPTTIDVPE
jgi:hypothetical protein